LTEHTSSRLYLDLHRRHREKLILNAFNVRVGEIIMKARAHVYVTGRVQGVFFRSETADVADRLGLTGWVRNLSDGRVEAVFEGEKENVDRALEFCRRGPPGAYVSDLDVTWEVWKGEFVTFRIVH
jgi:acylphosphatase